MGWLKIQNLDILRTEHNFSVPQMTHFEKLYFCSGGKPRFSGRVKN